MKVVIAMDSFKGSLSSQKAGEAVKNGVLRVFTDANCVVSPIADGGEGTVDALTEGLGGKFVYANVNGPLGETVSAKYGIVNGSTAVMEMSAAAGITLVPKEKKDPLYTTTFGVGQMIIHALDRGCRSFIMGIGGSATNDGGTGMLKALGFELLDEDGSPIENGAIGLSRLAKISDKNADPRLKDCKFSVACDVTNPLCGKTGCSAVFGPQKGATAQTIRQMDAWLESFAKLTKDLNQSSDAEYPGSGAAGGMGFAFRSYLGADLVKGIELVLRETRLEEQVKDADIVVCGEGRLDSQSVMGKAPVGVARLAKKYKKPVIAFSGCVTKDARVCNEHGIDAFFPILREVCTLDMAMDEENAYFNLSNTAEQVFRLVKASKTL